MNARKTTAPATGTGRREHLVKLAAELFARKGFQATTVREIADEAGILSGSLYHHFDSKETIVDEGGTPRDTLDRLVRRAFATLDPHRAAITVIQNDWNYLLQFNRFDYLTKAEQEVEQLWVDQIKRGQEAGEFRSDIDPKLTYRTLRDTIWVAVRWFRPGGALDAAGLADHYVKVLFDGVCTGERTSQRT